MPATYISRQIDDPQRQQMDIVGLLCAAPPSSVRVNSQSKVDGSMTFEILHGRARAAPRPPPFGRRLRSFRFSHAQPLTVDERSLRCAA
jgi:hypothetical protein